MKLACLALVTMITFAGVSTAAEFRLSTFRADVTPPLGHPLLAGATITPAAKEIADPLFASGLVLSGGEKPIVIVAVDWCEIRNEAYDRWRAVLAEAAGTQPQRVLLSCIHQHDAPLPDLAAQRILEKHQAAGKIFDLEFHETVVQRVAKALRESLSQAVPVTHLGLGQAKVEQVSSNRRYIGADGQPKFDRSSGSGGDAFKREAPEGTIDPWLKTLSFWNGDKPVAALSSYAVHPMSYWGTGAVSADFPGLARQRRQDDDPDVFQMYASGASGNVTAGKYNDASPANRPVLTGRMYAAMQAAWKSTRKVPLTQANFKSVEFQFKPRESPGFTVADLTAQLKNPDTRKQCLAALGSSWRQRAESDRPLDLPAIDFGPAQIVLLPGESYVEYQLLAQSLRPDSFVMVLGYGECGTGYVPIERAWTERDGNLDTWCWIAPGAEEILTNALKSALNK